jgi:hypothetical protein
MLAVNQLNNLACLVRSSLLNRTVGLIDLKTKTITSNNLALIPKTYLISNKHSNSKITTILTVWGSLNVVFL